MSTSQAIAPERSDSASLRRILALLVVSVAINYVDRGNLSLAAPLLKDELRISASQLGMLLSAFFWTYAGFQIIAGWLVNRFDVKWVLAAGFLFWSLATAGTAAVRGFGLLLGLRLLLGIGESVAYPAYAKILASRYQEDQRGFANGLIDAGTKCGPALGTLFGGVLMSHYGWRPFFAVLGLVSLLWLPFWIKWMPRDSPLPNARDHAGPSISEILGKRSAWATFIGHFCSNYFLYFLLTWLPFYLVRERHFSISTMSYIVALTYFVTAATTTLTGWMADSKIARGATPTRVRKTCAGVGLAFATLVVAVTGIKDQAGSIAVLMLGCIAFGIYASSHWAISQTLAGPQAAAKWAGLQNFIANLAGIAAPAVTGFVVDRSGQFFWAFAVAAAVVLAGAAVYVFGIGRIEPVRWRCDVAAENALPAALNPTTP
ncbi:MAG: MFS transporter [Bryobacteraceae bacterium]